MAFDVLSAVRLFKTRKDMLPGLHPRDEYITARVNAVVNELERTGIHLTDSMDDMLLVVDMAVWRYNNRDHAGSVPDWLRVRRRERWLQDRAINEKAAEGAETE